ncbi:MAG: glycosyltransferase family 2 protein [Pseudomonadota bacterium]
MSSSSLAAPRQDQSEADPLLLTDTKVVAFPKAFRDLALSPAADPAPAPPSEPTERAKLGEILREMGAISRFDLARALKLHRQLDIVLGEVLLRHEFVSADVLAQALARQHSLGFAGPAPHDCPVTDAMARRLDWEVALDLRALPWRRVGGMVLVATARPDRLEELRAALPPEFGLCLFAVTTEAEIDARLAQIHGPLMARQAECRPPEIVSCRKLVTPPGTALLALAILAMLGAALVWPATAVRVFTALGLTVMLANLSLKIAALLSLRKAEQDAAPPAPTPESLPRISVLVPLHREPDIAPSLKRRLSALHYPRALLDICLVVEADDHATLDALRVADLPPWMRVIAVPDGHPKTKPRAMNYALSFARGDIVGIYDAEDAPAPDQLMRIAARFAATPRKVACLQGLLDFYNPTRNWMARCFTIEYANWFRLLLPGIARMGLVIPLGGTTVFFRRDVLEEVGGWDAHNVTEDADLGVRLARAGYVTEVIDTTTLEEANASPLAWVKQRSRWMKGYILTWLVHARDPRALWRDLGPKRTLGFHLLFVGAVLNAVLMPFMWSTIVVLFGIWHPLMAWLPGEGPAALGALMLGATLVHLSLMAMGCATQHHRKLRLWIPTLELYFPLATLAVWKAIAEIVLNPFHWDKTVHGTFGGTDSAEAIAALQNAMGEGAAPLAEAPPATAPEAPLPQPVPKVVPERAAAIA